MLEERDCVMLERCYADSMAKLFSLVDFERKSMRSGPSEWHLRRTEDILYRMRAPHLGLPVVHVAGTNGKGSVCAMIESCLRSGGFSTGFYSSPSLHRFTERIRVNSLPVSEKLFASAFHKTWLAAEDMMNFTNFGEPTLFEILTAMAFVCFRASGSDVVILETGLGGRLDSTNVVSPDVVAISSISLDHETVLGNSVRRIAFEKAGIIKPGCIVVAHPVEQEAMAVVREVTEREDGEIIDVAESTSLEEASSPFEGGQEVHVRTSRAEYRFVLPLLGVHQLDNCRTAISVLEAIPGIAITPEAVVNGMESVRWDARVQLVCSDLPRIIADGCHNPASVFALKLALERHFQGRSGEVFVFGATNGHNFIDSARILSSSARAFFVTQSRHPRTIPADLLTRQLKEAGINVTDYTSSLPEALDMAKAAAMLDDVIVACGSLFVAAEAIEEVLGIEPELYPV